MTSVREVTEGIEWGVLIVLPNGANDVEVRPGQHARSMAVAAVDLINHKLGPDAAKLVYRTVRYGEWRADNSGDQWGVRTTWPDGHTEVQPTESRAEAERYGRLHNGRGLDSIAQAVSRTLNYDDWWLADAPVGREAP